MSRMMNGVPTLKIGELIKEKTPIMWEFIPTTAGVALTVDRSRFDTVLVICQFDLRFSGIRRGFVKDTHHRIEIEMPPSFDGSKGGVLTCKNAALVEVEEHSDDLCLNESPRIRLKFELWRSGFNQFTSMLEHNKYAHDEFSEGPNHSMICNCAAWICPDCISSIEDPVFKSFDVKSLQRRNGNYRTKAYPPAESVADLLKAASEMAFDHYLAD